MLVPQVQHLQKADHEAHDSQEASKAAERAVDGLLSEGEFAFAPTLHTPIEDIRYHDLVAWLAPWVPAYHYRFLPASEPGVRTAVAQHLRPHAYVGALPLQLDGLETRDLGDGLVYRLEPLEERSDPFAGIGIAKLLGGPGIDRPFDHPDATYDPWTGYYKDSGGHFFDLWGNELENPPRRTYFPELELWRDAFGDYWNAEGKLVRSNPEERTAP